MMLERGLSADEIERVLGAKMKMPDDRKPQIKVI